MAEKAAAVDQESAKSKSTIPQKKAGVTKTPAGHSSAGTTPSAEPKKHTTTKSSVEGVVTISLQDGPIPATPKKGEVATIGLSPRLIKIETLVLEEPFSTLLSIEDETYEAIRDDMKVNGCDPSHPIDVWRKGGRDVLVDGFTRIKAAKELGIAKIFAFSHTFPDENAALDFFLKAQVNRRNLKDNDLIRLVELYDKKRTPGDEQSRVDGKFAPKASSDANGKSATETAQKFGVSTTKIERARRVLRSAGPKLKLMVLGGKVSVNEAVNKIRKLEAPNPGVNNHVKRGVKKVPTQADYAPFDLFEWPDLAFATWPVVEEEPGAEGGKATFALNNDKLVMDPKAKALKNAEKKFGNDRVFVCPEVDLFASDLPAQALRDISKATGEATQFDFLFWTSKPSALAEMAWHGNTFAGVSIRTQKDVNAAEKAFKNLKTPRKWLSIEQLTMTLTFTCLADLAWMVVRKPNGMGKAAHQPDALKSLLRDAWDAGCPVFFEDGVAYRPTEAPKALPPATGEGDATGTEEDAEADAADGDADTDADAEAEGKDAAEDAEAADEENEDNQN